MPYALVATHSQLLAGLSDGRILRSADGGESWDEIGVRVESMSALAVDM